MSEIVNECVFGVFGMVCMCVCVCVCVICNLLCVLTITSKPWPSIFAPIPKKKKKIGSAFKLLLSHGFSQSEFEKMLGNLFFYLLRVCECHYKSLVVLNLWIHDDTENNSSGTREVSLTLKK